MRKASFGEMEEVWFQVAIKPIKDYWWQRVSEKTVDLLTKNKDIFLFGFLGNGKIIVSDLRWTTRMLLLPAMPFIWLANTVFNLFTSTGKGVIQESTIVTEDAEQVVKTSEYNSAACKGIFEKASKPAFKTSIRMVYLSGKSASKIQAKQKIFSVAASFRQFYSPSANGFDQNISDQTIQLKHYVERKVNTKKMYLNTEELATIYHLPNVLVQTPGIYWVTSKKMEPPTNLPTFKNSKPEDLTLLGKTNFRGYKEEFGILPDDRRRHIYIIGKTGMGKSTLLENMIFSDIYAGKGLAVVDPHGELADSVLSFVPRERAEDLIVCDPSDISYPVSINMLEDPGTPEARSLIASGMVGVFKKMFADSWGPRLEHVLRNVLLALAEYPDSNMLGIMRILVDAEYRKKVVDNVTDPVVKSFWEGEFANYAPRNIAEIISPIQNKVGQFLSSPIVRNIVGQTKSTIKVREAMDTGKILIVNLSKGKIGEDNSTLLGSMLITKFQLDAMSRANIEASKRRDFYLYVDEFQNFATDSFATILSEARKYKLNLTMANQYIAQMSDVVRDAVFGNVGSILSFQTGYDDAVYLSTQFSEIVSPEDITSLNKFTIYSRLLVYGMPSPAFSANTLYPPDVQTSDEMIKYLMDLSRYKYSTKREDVETAIKNWSSEYQHAEGAPNNNGNNKQKKEKPSFDMSKLKVGQKLKTNVVGICDYGLFLSFQGVEGLLHINKIPKEERKIMKTVQKGDLLESTILEIREGNKLAFTLLPVDEAKSLEKEVEKASQKLEEESAPDTKTKKKVQQKHKKKNTKKKKKEDHIITPG
jgi:predicted RNA-binding protein with RPS1 domain